MNSLPNPGAFLAAPPPWSLSGWHDEAGAWIRAELALRGQTVIGEIEKVREWGLSSVLRAQTEGEATFYFKAAADLPLFGNEPAITALLAQLYPDLVPAPIACEPIRRWMLLPDAGRSLREGESLSDDQLATLFHTFGLMQRDSTEEVGRLLAVGCLDRRLPVLRDQLDTVAEGAGDLPSAVPEEIARFRPLLPRLKEMCAELEDFGIPSATLAHGDLHLGNVLWRNAEEFVFIDWTDACITHPFLDMIGIMGVKEVDRREFLRDTYLAVWTGYETMERLREAWKIAEPLAALHQTVTQYYILANQVQPYQNELASALPFWMKRVNDLMMLPKVPE